MKHLGTLSNKTAKLLKTWK